MTRDAKYYLHHCLSCAPSFQLLLILAKYAKNASKVFSYLNLYKLVILFMKECEQTIPRKKTLGPVVHPKVSNMSKVNNISCYFS